MGLSMAYSSQWPRGLRRRSAVACLMRSWVRIPPGEWMFVCCECCVLSGRGLCDELITRPEESYRLWWVVVCDLETSRMRRPWPALGRRVTEKKNGVVVEVLLVVVGPAGRPHHDQQHCYHHTPKVKPEAATGIVELLMTGMRTPETCWAVNKRQVINWKNFCI